MNQQADERPAGGNPTGLSQNYAATSEHVPAMESSRDDAARAVVDAADPWATGCWRTAINYLASTGRPFTVDDGHALGAPMPDRPNAIGGLFIAAAAAGQIKAVGYTSSRRRSRHNGVQRVWVGSDVA